MPAAITFAGISFVTTEPAPIIELSPIFTPFKIITLKPHQTLLPIIISFAGKLEIPLLSTSKKS